MTDHPAFENVAGESHVVGTDEFDWATLEAAIDGVPSPDALEQARREGAAMAAHRLLDMLIHRPHLSQPMKTACRQIGFRAVLLAMALHHPSVGELKSMKAFAKAYGMSQPHAVQASRRLRKKFGMV